MGSLSQTEQRKLAYFHALSKSMTENTQEVYESRYKSSHNIRLNEVWSDDISFANTYNDAVNESMVNDAVTLNEMVELSMIPGSNGQSYAYISGGTFDSLGNVTPGGVFIRPWVAPTDIPDPISNLPSNGYQVRLFRQDDSEIFLTTGAWSVDYYTGIIHFAEDYTPDDLGWGDIKATIFHYSGNFGTSGSTNNDNLWQDADIIYDDWFLPSFDELEKMYENLHSGEDENATTFSPIGDFSGVYWSSSEFDSGETWALDFDTSSGLTDFKNNNNYVRPIRQFKSENNYNLRDNIGGGYIFYINDLGTGAYIYYVSSLKDEESFLSWSDNTDLIGTTGLLIGDGVYNTNVINNKLEDELETNKSTQYSTDLEVNIGTSSDVIEPIDNKKVDAKSIINLKVQTGNVLYVTPFGDDLTGERGLINKPYETITAALNESRNDDLIYVYPGYYNKDNYILRSNRNYYFSPGAIVEAYGDDDEDKHLLNYPVGQAPSGYHYVNIFGQGVFRAFRRLFQSSLNEGDYYIECVDMILTANSDNSLMRLDGGETGKTRNITIRSIGKLSAAHVIFDTPGNGSLKNINFDAQFETVEIRDGGTGWGYGTISSFSGINPGDFFNWRLKANTFVNYNPSSSPVLALLVINSLEHSNILIEGELIDDRNTINDYTISIYGGNFTWNGDITGVRVGVINPFGNGKDYTNFKLNGNLKTNNPSNGLIISPKPTANVNVEINGDISSDSSEYLVRTLVNNSGVTFTHNGGIFNDTVNGYGIYNTNEFINLVLRSSIIKSDLDSIYSSTPIDVNVIRDFHYITEPNPNVTLVTDYSKFPFGDAIETVSFDSGTSSLVFNSGDTTQTIIDLSPLKAVSGSTSLLSVSNSNMVAENTSFSSPLACSTPLSDNISGSKVFIFVNGLQINVGNSNSDDCYFSDDGGSTKKASGQEIAGDLLYWNYNGSNNPVAGYELSTVDRISFLNLIIN